MSVTSVAQKWVSEAAGMTQPSRVVWCDGSKAEYDGLIETMLQDGTLLPLNPRTYPNCYLHRSHPSDVARTEQLTFICAREKDSVGPTNNWIAPIEAKSTAGALFRGSMRGRTMYVIPYLMGPAGSPMSRVGLMVTDSAYVVASMHIMTRVGQVAIQHMRRDEPRDGGVAATGLARLDARRRHRVDVGRRQRPAPRRQSRAGLLRRRAQHEPQDEPERDLDGALEHDLHQRG